MVLMVLVRTPHNRDFLSRNRYAISFATLFHCERFMTKKITLIAMIILLSFTTQQLPHFMACCG